MKCVIALGKEMQNNLCEVSFKVNSYSIALRR